MKLVVPTSILLFFISFFFSCADKKKELPFIEYTGPIQTIDNFSVMVSDSGRTKVKMSTAKYLVYSNKDEKYPKAVFVNFLNDNGVEYSSLRGDSGRRDFAKNLYIVKGNVFFFNRLMQQSMATEELFWNPATRKIYSNKKVTIHTPTENIIATGGMEADEDFSRYSLKRPKGVFLVDSLRTIVDTTSQQ